jgi:hypothetical protein
MQGLEYARIDTCVLFIHIDGCNYRFQMTARDEAVRLAGGGVFKIAAAGKPDRYKGFVPGEGFVLNTNPCGRSWSCATAAMAS